MNETIYTTLSRWRANEQMHRPRHDVLSRVERASGYVRVTRLAGWTRSSRLRMSALRGQGRKEERVTGPYAVDGAAMHNAAESMHCLDEHTIMAEKFKPNSSRPESEDTESSGFCSSCWTDLGRIVSYGISDQVEGLRIPARKCAPRYYVQFNSASDPSTQEQSTD